MVTLLSYCQFIIYRTIIEWFSFKKISKTKNSGIAKCLEWSASFWLADKYVRITWTCTIRGFKCIRVATPFGHHKNSIRIFQFPRYISSWIFSVNVFKIEICFTIIRWPYRIGTEMKTQYKSIAISWINGNWNFKIQLQSVFVYPDISEK